MMKVIKTYENVELEKEEKDALIKTVYLMDNLLTEYKYKISEEDREKYTEDTFCELRYSMQRLIGFLAYMNVELEKHIDNFYD